MSRLPQVSDAGASQEVRELFDTTTSQLGRVPNLYRTLANSPDALRGCLAFREALTEGVLPPDTREKVAFVVAVANDCDYCVSAHAARGRKMGWSRSQLESLSTGGDDDLHVAALLRLAIALVHHRGSVDDGDIADARAAGASDQELAEVLAHVALNTYSNMLNHFARPDLDFPNWHTSSGERQDESRRGA